METARDMAEEAKAIIKTGTARQAGGGEEVH